MVDIFIKVVLLFLVPLRFADISHSSTFNLHIGCLFFKNYTFKKVFVQKPNFKSLVHGLFLNV